MKKEKYWYFVSFSHEQGFGNTCVFLEEKIKTIDDIKQIQEYLNGQEDKVCNVVILNWVELEGDVK